jgi:hypothetical protein
MTDQAAAIRTLETTYKGVRFRSRLEARWAVFFDAAHIAWEYEPEGYRLPDGTCYVPDFWLPGMLVMDPVRYGIFVEVKPDSMGDCYGDGVDEVDQFAKARAFAVCIRRPVLLARGTPTDSWYSIAGFNEEDPRGEVDAQFSVGETQGEHPNKWREAILLVHEGEDINRPELHGFQDHAFDAARNQRFWSPE